MAAPNLHPTRRARAASSPRVLVGTLAIAGLGPLACAAHHHVNEAPPHPIGVEIQNNVPPMVLTVFITHDQGGFNQLLGTVPGGKTQTFTYTPSSWDITYRLKATRGAQPTGSQAEFISPPFNVNDPTTGTVVWNLTANQVQFYDLPAQQQAPAKDTTKAAPPSGP